jgi:type I restriction enzyme S subunit
MEERVPKTWTTVRLGEFVVSEKGKKPKRQNDSFSRGFCHAYVDIEAFEKGIIKSWTDGKNCKFCTDKDFLMVWDGSRSGLVGKAINGAIGSTLVKLNLPGIYNGYAYHFLQSKYIEINNRARGTGTPHVDPELLWNYLFSIPPLNEQKRIVQKIEKLFSELDAGVASLRQARTQLKVYRQSLLKQAFEGKLTEKWRAEHPDQIEPADQLLERVTKQKAKTVQPHARSEWLTIHLGELTEYVTSGSRGWAAYYSESGSIFIRAQNLKTDWLDLNDIAYVNLPEKVEGLRTLTKKGDLLITITGANVTKSAYVDRELGDAYVSQHVALCRFFNPELSKFLYLYIVSPAGGRRDLEKAAYGAGKPGLNLTNIRELKVPLCSLPEQQEIVRILEAQLEAIEQNDGEIDAALKRSEALRQSILKKAFSGQLVPQDPNDEPASILLERIRAERAAAEAERKATRSTSLGRAKKTTKKQAVEKEASA